MQVMIVFRGYVPRIFENLWLSPLTASQDFAGMKIVAPRVWPSTDEVEVAIVKKRWRHADRSRSLCRHPDSSSHSDDSFTVDD